VRIEAAAEAERQRLLEQTRREIDMRLRVARRELVEHAADLAVQVASTRIRQTITPDDQARLVDRYTTQLGTGGRA
jgi:F0F1-type ATP synthase membrane subunit b/b'